MLETISLASIDSVSKKGGKISITWQGLAQTRSFFLKFCYVPRQKFHSSRHMTLADTVVAVYVAAGLTVFSISTTTHEKLRKFNQTIILVLRHKEIDDRIAKHTNETRG